MNCHAKCLFVLAMLMGVTQIAAAQQHFARPIRRIKSTSGVSRRASPLAIPQQFAPPQEAFASFPETAAAAPPVQSACRVSLANVAEFHVLPVLVGPGECGAADAVLLQAVILPDQTKVVIAPPATLRCTMAEQIARWIREDVAPTATKLGSPLHELDNLNSYECRGRNRGHGATLSEHGRANALDVRALKLADGRSMVLTDVNVEKDWRKVNKSERLRPFLNRARPWLRWLSRATHSPRSRPTPQQLQDMRVGCAGAICAGAGVSAAIAGIRPVTAATPWGERAQARPAE